MLWPLCCMCFYRREIGPWLGLFVCGISWNDVEWNEWRGGREWAERGWCGIDGIEMRETFTLPLTMETHRWAKALHTQHTDTWDRTIRHKTCGCNKKTNRDGEHKISTHTNTHMIKCLRVGARKHNASDSASLDNLTSVKVHMPKPQENIYFSHQQDTTFESTVSLKTRHLHPKLHVSWAKPMTCTSWWGRLSFISAESMGDSDRLWCICKPAATGWQKNNKQTKSHVAGQSL